MKGLIALVVLLPLAACTEQAWYSAAKNVECQSAGGKTDTACARSYSDDYRAMRQDEAKQGEK